LTIISKHNLIPCGSCREIIEVNLDIKSKKKKFYGYFSVPCVQYNSHKVTLKYSEENIQGYGV
jgi:hypothetical protein